jgi:uroporphyrinogen-III decarboxylase
MIDDFWTKNYIANLWHWINQFTPIENVRAFVQAIKEYKN